jgi:hypothetical protein
MSGSIRNPEVRMPTKITISRPGDGGMEEFEVEESAAAITRSIEGALERDEQFVSITTKDGSHLVVAADVVLVSEE